MSTIIFFSQIFLAFLVQEITRSEKLDALRNKLRNFSPFGKEDG